MHHLFDTVEFFLSLLFALLLAGLAVFALMRGCLYLDRRALVTYRERPRAFLGWLLLYAAVAFICAQEAFTFSKHFATP